MTKKVIFTVFVTLLAAGIFVGCSKKDTGSASSNGKETLVIGLQTNSTITDYKNNYLTQYLENLHDINIDFYMLPSDGAELRTKVSLMVSSNDLPDIIIPNGALNSDQILDYGSKGAFIPLNKYLDDPAKSPGFASIPKEDRDLIIRSSTSADGNIYTMVRFEYETWNQTPYRLYFNKAWADKLNVKVPTTTDELRTALIAFRDQDPNGNGRKDEIGITGQFSGGYGENVIAALLNSFIFWNPDNLALDASGNTVIAPFADPAFRQGIEFLIGLYKDGVLSPSIFTNNQQEFRGTLNSAPAVVALTSAGSFSNWTDANNNANFKELALIPPLKGPKGVNYTPYSEYMPTAAAMITSKAKNPDLAFKVLDSFMEERVSLIARYGEEGVDWSQKPEDLAANTNAYILMGVYPSLFLVEITRLWSDPNNKFWHNINPRYAPMDWAHRLGGSEPFDPSQATAPLHTLNYQNYLNKHPDKILPQLRYTADDAEKNAEVVANVNEYVRQSIAEFITGTRDISTGWDAYIKELNNMGLQQWISRAQATYNRQK